MSGAGAGAGLWRVSVAAPPALAPVFGAALEPLADSVSAFTVEGRPEPSVTALLARYPDHAAIVAAVEAAARAAGARTPDVAIEPLPEIDWLARNRESFPRLRHGRFLVHGSHNRPAARGGALAIEVDAGRAFGSGTHGSTEGCLRAMEGLSRSFRPRRVLDLGCGSGILSVAAALLWPRARVLAADIDPHAARTARGNAAVNGVARRVAAIRSDGYPGPPPAPGRRFDLVVANILAGPLVAMAPEAGRRLRPGGRLLLSGLLAGQEREVLAAYLPRGFAAARHTRVGMWSTLSLVRGRARRPAR